METSVNTIPDVEINDMRAHGQTGLVTALDPEDHITIQLVMLRLKLTEVFNIGLAGNTKDTWAWLNWMKNGGDRPKLNKRSAHIIPIAQTSLCAVLERYWNQIDWTNPAHCAFLERVTRPLPRVKPLGPPPQWLRA